MSGSQCHLVITSLCSDPMHFQLAKSKGKNKGRDNPHHTYPSPCDPVDSTGKNPTHHRPVHGTWETYNQGNLCTHSVTHTPVLIGVAHAAAKQTAVNSRDKISKSPSTYLLLEEKNTHAQKTRKESSINVQLPSSPGRLQHQETPVWILARSRFYLHFKTSFRYPGEKKMPVKPTIQQETTVAQQTKRWQQNSDPPSSQWWELQHWRRLSR